MAVTIDEDEIHRMARVLNLMEPGSNTAVPILDSRGETLQIGIFRDLEHWTIELPFTKPKKFSKATLAALFILGFMLEKRVQFKP